MQIVIDIPDKMYEKVLNGKNVEIHFGKYVTVKDVWVSELIRQGTPLPKLKQETVTEFADRCHECGKMIKQKYTDDVLDKIIAEIEQGIHKVNNGYDKVWNYALREVIKVIDEYKAESEGME